MAEKGRAECVMLFLDGSLVRAACRGLQLPSRRRLPRAASGGVPLSGEAWGWSCPMGSGLGAASEPGLGSQLGSPRVSDWERAP